MKHEFSFSVADEPWGIAVDDAGVLRELGLRDILKQAHELRAVSDPLPTVECGLLRLLVALVLDIFEPHDALDLAELLQASRFDADRIDKYFERYADRFDLFHSQHPFLQTPMPDDKPKPLAGLLAIVPSGTNALHFHRTGEGEFAVCPEVAARLLTTIAPFMTAGGAGLPPSINGAPPFYVLLRGNTLFETVLLNCPVEQSLLPHAKIEDDLPLWRCDEPIKAEARAEAGVLQSLTWAPRRIELVPGEGGHCSVTGEPSTVLVRSMKFGPGWSSRFEAWTDPNVPYRIGEKDRTVLRLQEERPLWRDAGPLALLRQETYQSPAGQKFRFERPMIVSQFAELQRQKWLPIDELRLTIYGMRTDLKMKVFEWQRGELRLPIPLVLNGDFAARAQTEIDRAERVAYAIGRAIKTAYPREGAGNNAAFDELISRARRQFWDTLEPHFMSGENSLLEDLARLKTENADSEQIDQRILAWRAGVLRVGREALDAAIEDLDADSDALERQVIARNFFFGTARNILGLAPEKSLTEKSKKKGESNG